eukprot:1257966-Rhodomonas_salina.1
MARNKAADEERERRKKTDTEVPADARGTPCPVLTAHVKLPREIKCNPRHFWYSLYCNAGHLSLISGRSRKRAL